MVGELDDRALLPGLARRELRVWMGDHPALGDLEAIASELVTNAALHGAGPWVRMSLRPAEEREWRYWRLTVVDPGLSATVPIPRMPGLEETTGRGLWVVDALTGGCWETSLTQAGERVVSALLPR
jgi:anti-sigma regulatory factor (Ser/Thr protein kinase)